MAWFSKTKKLKASQTARGGPEPVKKGEGVWQKCDGCAQVVLTQDWERNWNICPLCGHHDALPVRRRLEMVLDGGSFEELDAELTPQDPLGFVDSGK